MRGVPGRAIGQKFDLTEASLWSHSIKHISEGFRRTVLVGPLTLEAVTDESRSVLQSLCAIYNGHFNQWQLAVEVGADDKMAMHAQVLTNIAWRIEQLTGQVTASQTIIQNNTMQFFDNPEVTATIAALTTALKPYPEARAAVAEALRLLPAGGKPALRLVEGSKS